MALYSPGVEIIEIDASQIAPSVSNAIACFSGDFKQGPVGVYMLITNEDDLVTYYGKPTKTNYNDWMQASTFLKYGDKLFVSRAANTNASTVKISGLSLTADVSTNTVHVNDSSLVKVEDTITFGDASGVSRELYKVVSIVDSTTITLDRAATADMGEDDKVYSIVRTINSVFDAVSQGATAVDNDDYLSTMIPIHNYNDYESLETSIAMNSMSSKLKLIAKNPGAWGNDIEVVIAKAGDFRMAKQAFDGISLDDLFEYFPTGSDVGIVVRHNDVIQEVFTVSFDPNAKDQNNKSKYVETVINTKSAYLFAKDNIDNDTVIQSYLFSNSNVIKLVNGTDSPIGMDDLINGYNVWDNKEEVDRFCPAA